MPIKIYKEKMEYLKKMLQELPQKTNPKDYHSTPNVTITWVENCSGKTKIREQELVSDENAHSTGFGKGVSPAHTFFAERDTDQNGGTIEGNSSKRQHYHRHAFRL